MNYDVRNEDTEEIDTIIFGEPINLNQYRVAYKIDRYESGDMINIRDKEDHVLVVSKEHAENLILALKKAIALGWIV